MRRAFIAKDNAAGLLGLPLCFALHQHLNPFLQQVQIPVLTGDDIGHVIDCADEMRKAFFKGVQIV